MCQRRCQNFIFWRIKFIINELSCRIISNMQTKYICKLVFYFLLFQCVSFASNIVDISNLKSDNLLKNSYIYTDQTNSETIETIKDKRFTSINQTKSLSFGYSPNFTLWIKFTLTNNSDEVKEKIIEYENGLTTDLKFYNGTFMEEEGLFHIKSNRKTINPNFLIKLKPNETKTYYLQIFTSITTLIVNLSIHDTINYYEEELKHQNILMIFFSSMIILALYNIFVYFFTRVRSYLYYVFYIFTICLHQFFYVGFANIYIQEMYFMKIAIENAAIIVALPALSLALFTSSFINTKENFPKIHKYLKIYLIFFPMIILIIVLREEHGWLRNIFSVILLVSLFIITIYSVVKKNRQGYFLLFGWIVFFLSGMMMFLSSLGVYNFYDVIPYFIEIFLVFEAVIFSIALSDRIKELQKEKDNAQNSLIKQQKTETKRLEKMVDDKTIALQSTLVEKEILLKELNHRVKNNMQTIISLIRLQRDEVKDKKVEEMLITIQNRINAMNQLHQLLYTQNQDLSSISPTEYFESIVSEIQQSTYSEDILVRYNIQAKVSTEQAVYCGLIVNELVTNCIKHAFLINKGEIEIGYFNKNNKNILIVRDNGIGISDNANDSLGMSLIKSLVEMNLNGVLRIENNNGTLVQIEWEE